MKWSESEIREKLKQRLQASSKLSNLRYSTDCLQAV
jgi:hypothetical protein